MGNPRVGWLFALLAMFGGCSGVGAAMRDRCMQPCVDAEDPSEPDRPADAEDPGADAEAARPTRGERLQQLRTAMLATINGSTCPGAGCQMIAFQPVPATPAAASEGARILLIDEAITMVAATRYQSRTLGYLSHDLDGNYRTSGVTLQLPRDALSVFQAADQFVGPLASEEIGVVAAFGAKFGGILPGWIGHGMDILPFLEDRIPRAQFLVSEALLDYPLSDPQICAANDPATREPAIQRLEAQVLNTQHSLASLIQQYAINYIHLSWGTTRAEIERFLQSRCGAAPPRDVIDRIQGAYLTLLSSLAGLSTTVAGQPRPVLLVQAGTGADHELHADDPDFLTDCAAFPGRLRIFAAAYTGTDLPAAGSTDPRFSTDAARRSLACIDLVVNVGYSGPFNVRAAPAYFPTSSLGLGVAGPEWPAVSSFANPVGLAYVAYLADQHPGETVAQVMARITNQWTKPVVDPLLYGRFPRPSQP